MSYCDIPVAICWHHIVDLQLLRDLLNAQMQSVCVKLLSSHGRVDGCGQAHQTSSLVLTGISPSVALLALSGTVRRCHTTLVKFESGVVAMDLPRSGLRPRFSSDRPSAGAEGL